MPPPSGPSTGTMHTVCLLISYWLPSIRVHALTAYHEHQRLNSPAHAPACAGAIGIRAAAAACAAGVSIGIAQLPQCRVDLFNPQRQRHLVQADIRLKPSL